VKVLRFIVRFLLVWCAVRVQFGRAGFHSATEILSLWSRGARMFPVKHSIPGFALWDGGCSPWNTAFSGLRVWGGSVPRGTSQLLVSRAA